MRKLLLILITTFSIANTQAQTMEETTIDIAGHSVPVLKGGLYDRYRSNTPLSIIAAEYPNIDLSWFETLSKKKVGIGFESYSPNFYYSNSSITAIFTADLNRLRELIPHTVLEQVSPIAMFPKRGLVALTFYSYHICDNDTYNEFSLSVVVTKPKSKNLGIISLAKQLSSKDFWGYVLKLPVNTELARVRGVVGYNLPKWLTPINYTENNQSITFEIIDSTTGKVDISMQGTKLNVLSDKERITQSNFINLNSKNQLVHGYTKTRQLKSSSSRKHKDVALALTEGDLSKFIKSLKLDKMVKYEYAPEFQSALYAPELFNK